MNENNNQFHAKNIVESQDLWTATDQFILQGTSWPFPWSDAKLGTSNLGNKTVKTEQNSEQVYLYSIGLMRRQLIKKVTCTVQSLQGTNIFQYCTSPARRGTYNIHSSCKHMYLSFKSVCNKEHKGVICNTTSSSNFSQSTRTGRVLWEELHILSRFHS